MKNDIIQNIRLDLNAPKIKSSLSVRIGDTCTRTIHVTLTSGGKVVSLENALVALIEIEKPDGNHCYNDCVISGNEVQYTITTQSVNVEGTCKCQINVTFEDGGIVSSPIFDMVVYSLLVDQSNMKSQNEYTALTQHVVMANKYAGDAESAKRNAQEAAAKAEESKTAAGISESNAAESEKKAGENKELAAKEAEKAVASSEAAGISEKNAKASEIAADESASAASESKNAAKISEDNAIRSEQKAKEYGEKAESSAQSAERSETTAIESKTTAENKAREATNSAEAARRYMETVQSAGILTLGHGPQNAMPGDEGKKAYDHTLSTENPHKTTYSQVGADKEGAAQQAYDNAIVFIKNAIAELINGAPETLDTLKEIADAMEANHTIVEALEEAVGTRATKEEFTNHKSDTIVHISKEERTTWNNYGTKITDMEKEITELKKKQGYPV
mgnify:FL=1